MSDLDIQAKERNEHLLAQARLQMEEEEDEIKHLNEMILQVCRWLSAPILSPYSLTCLFVCFILAIPRMFHSYFEVQVKCSEA